LDYLDIYLVIWIFQWYSTIHICMILYTDWYWRPICEDMDKKLDLDQIIFICLHPWLLLIWLEYVVSSQDYQMLWATNGHRRLAYCNMQVREKSKT